MPVAPTLPQAPAQHVLFSNGKYGSMMAFMATPDFATCLAEYAALVDRMADFAANHAGGITPPLLPSTVEGIRKHLAVLKRHLTDTRYDFFSAHKEVVFGLGKQMFHELDALLAQEKIPLKIRLNAIMKMAPQFEVCPGGFLTVLGDEITTLKYSTAGIKGAAYLVKLQMIRNLITLHVKNHHHGCRPADELHYVNCYFNHMPEQLGVGKAVDPNMSMAQAELTPALIKTCVELVLQKLMPSALARDLSGKYASRLREEQPVALHGTLEGDALMNAFESIELLKRTALNKEFEDMPTANYLLPAAEPYAYRLARQDTLGAQHIMGTLKKKGIVDFADTVELRASGEGRGTIMQLGSLLWRFHEDQGLELGAAELMRIPLSTILADLDQAALAPYVYGNLLQAHVEHVLGEWQRENLTNIPDHWLDAHVTLFLQQRLTHDQIVPALLLAATFDKTAATARMIDGGADINGCDSDGVTALMMAAKNGNCAVLAQLIKAGANVDAVNVHGMSAAMLAAANGHTAILQQLVKAGVDIDRGNSDGTTLAMFAIQNGHLQTLRAIIALHADLQVAERNGYNSVMMAAENGHVEILRLLLARGCSVDAVDHWGNTAAMFAAEKGRNATLRILLEHGADFDAVNETGFDALMGAAEFGHTEAVRVILLARPALDRCDIHGHSALIYAAKFNHAGAMKALLDAGAPVDLADIDRYTALCHAAQRNHVEPMRLLLKHGADFDTVDDDYS
ncbi:MAG: ankyrin repeat domain-containing protein, partial [Janthinobacterium lividum]